MQTMKESSDVQTKLVFWAIGAFSLQVVFAVNRLSLQESYDLE
jgi:hypothetical protein